MRDTQIDELIRSKQPLPNGLTQTGDLILAGYPHPLPESLTHTGNLWLDGYQHPLPENLAYAAGISMVDYPHPLPAGLTVMGSILARGNRTPSQTPEENLQ